VIVQLQHTIMTKAGGRLYWAIASATLIWLLLAAPAEAGPAMVPPEIGQDALRSEDKLLTKAIEIGMKKSATLRRLEDQLRAGHVIVYLMRDPHMPPGLIGRTRFITSTGPWRYLAIDLDYRLIHLDLLSTLGHELQHAAEIAAAPEVVDEASLTALYRRIGVSGGRSLAKGVYFETHEAAVVGKQVHRELTGAGDRHD
jgi:hypothetical protein